MLKRTHTCGELRLGHQEEDVVLNGWVDAVRDHGGLVFIELRDRYGFTQVVADPDELAVVAELKPEFVIAVRGRVRPRPTENLNPDKPTGEIEVVARDLEILNVSKTPPFEIKEEIPTREELRLEYRYLDMRRRKVLHAMEFRGRLTSVIRRVFDGRGFIDVETPVLMKTSPEGARDFIVPSRVRPGWVYGLPQSPQLFKQTLMVAGLDRYYQICKCFRDEDLRADRQPEFTQLDMEMSFVSQDDVFEVVEEAMVAAWKEMKGVEVSAPFDRMTYAAAMERFGSDKPDRRFGLELTTLTEVFHSSGFRVFKDAIARGGVVRGLRVPGGARLSRKDIDGLEATAREYGARGLPWVKIQPEGPQGGISKFLSEDEARALERLLGAEAGDLVVFGCDTFETASLALGQVRLHLGRTLGLIDESRVDMLWVTDFPLFEWNEEEQRWQAMHHMFTAPRGELPAPGEDLSGVRADLYDLVMNGSEVGSGSIRIHRPEIQRRIFELIGISEKEAAAKFGWFLRALDYGAPPHGGIALGLDRIAMIMLGAGSLRDVIAFPKTTSGACPLTGCPSPADSSQWEELGLRVVAEE